MFGDRYQPHQCHPDHWHCPSCGELFEPVAGDEELTCRECGASMGEPQLPPPWEREP